MKKIKIRHKTCKVRGDCGGCCCYGCCSCNSLRLLKGEERTSERAKTNPKTNMNTPQWTRTTSSMSSRRLNTTLALSCLLSLTSYLVQATYMQQQQQQQQTHLLQQQHPQQLQLGPQSGIKFEPESNSYSGLTFTFDPRLDKRVEWLHFEHWLSIMQQTSSLLYESLNGRAHLSEVRVLIPYKWRQNNWPVLHKPGIPIIMNRRLLYSDSDVIVGFEDAVHRETPYAVQHDECAKQGLNIQMPISFLEQQTLDARLKARLLVREFASHRFGIFKESGFRGDFMYPPFASLPGVPQARATLNKSGNRTQFALILDNSSDTPTLNQTEAGQSIEAGSQIRGFDEHWRECEFETAPSSGLPTQNSINCAPYLSKNSDHHLLQQQQQQRAPLSFNLMSADPFSYSEDSERSGSGGGKVEPLQWHEVASNDGARWHFCGENFVAPANSLLTSGGGGGGASEISGSSSNLLPTNQQKMQQQSSFAHNQLATNKQNVMCNERSALEVIKSSQDFRRTPFSASTFNRLPEPNFKFLQEMPQRIVLCVEFGLHLYQSRRLDQGILEPAIGKFLAFDLIADTEFSLVLFGQQQSTRSAFKRLDSAIDARFTLFNPPIDPFDEPAKFYTEQELAQLDIQVATGNSGNSANQIKVVKGTCSFGRALSEALALQQQRIQYDDVGSDMVIITSGLFIEDETKIEELLRQHFKPEVMQLNLIIYPSNMLFDTKSRDGFVVLNAIESESIVRQRINKLLLIQRLTNAKIHLVKEYLDANGDVKMSTLVQFYQIFDHISKGHSWDQTHSMALISQQAIEGTRPQPMTGNGNGSSKLVFQFQLDNSAQNELIVGFFDPKHHHQRARAGKRFAIKQLQLRSPGGHLIVSDSHPIPTYNHQMAPPSADNDFSSQNQHGSVISGSSHLLLQEEENNNGSPLLPGNNMAPGAGSSSLESTLFPYRTQLNLAGFHLKAAHLAQLNATNKLAGIWTLTAISEEQIQTHAIAMARVNPAGDTVTANCWIQTYYTEQQSTSQSTNSIEYSSSDSWTKNSPLGGAGQLSAVKVFVQTRAGVHVAPLQDLNARLEVQDELGNIVQNTNMLDDGLGVPDMTRGDGIHSQFVQRAHRPGYYKVNVELSSANRQQWKQHSQTQKSPAQQTQGQSNTCCGSFFPPTSGAQVEGRYVSRQLYCGSFHVEAQNRLAQQRPPRVNNLTVVNVDQENRRVTLRWFEPSVDISSPLGGATGSTKLNLEQLELNNALHQPSDSPSSQEVEMLASSQQMALQSSPSNRPTGKGSRHTPRAPLLSMSASEEEEQQQQQPDDLMMLDSISGHNQQRTSISGGRNHQMGVAHIQAGNQALASESMAQQLANRYEIKLFSDRDAIRRSFDAKHEVGYKFNEWNVEGAFPNASNYGGMKEVTLRIPNSREGVYYLAMKVYNNLGLGSQMSTIVQFWIRNNLTLEEAESIYGQATTVDSDGNVYDKNGELIQRAGQLNYSLLKSSAYNMDSLYFLIFVSVLGFVLSVICVSLVLCLTNSERRSKSEDKKKVTSSAGAIMGAPGSGSSSMVSSGCGSSQQSELASSISGGMGGGVGGCGGGGSQGGHDIEINKLAIGVVDELSYGQLQHQQHQQQQQAQLIQQQQMALNNRNGQLQETNPYVSATANYQAQQQQYTDAIYQQQRQAQMGHFSPQDGAQNGGKNLHHQQPWLQHKIVNGYAYATVNNNNNNNNNNNSYQQQQLDSQPTNGNMNQNGMMSPVQSWPADILLSHYDKVKQARERNEAPPVMRIETLEGQGTFGEAGLTSVDEQQQQQLADQSYLLRHKQLNKMPSYFNHQLQQQLTSVLKSKQRASGGQQQQQQQHERQLDLNKSSPALEGVTGEFDELDLPPVPMSAGSMNNDNNNYQMQDHQLAPPQYVYCSPQAADNGLACTTTDPSIYSQLTNIQQVVSSSNVASGGNVIDTTTTISTSNSGPNNFYANQPQWPPISISANNVNNQTGSTNYAQVVVDHQQQQFNRGSSNSSSTAELDYAADKSNSAVSEV